VHVVSLEPGVFYCLGEARAQLAKTVGSPTAGELEIAFHTVYSCIQQRAHRIALVLGVIQEF